MRLPADAVLPDVRGLQGPLSCLTEARFGIVWGAMGAARACLEAALDYAKTREQFGRPIGGFQLTQAEARRHGGRARHGRRCWRCTSAGARRPARCRPSRSASASSTTSARRSTIARSARTILGANGISLEYPVIRHANNLESVLTYEGTEEIHTAGPRQGPHRSRRLPLTRLRRSGPRRIVQRVGGPGADEVVGRYLQGAGGGARPAGPGVRVDAPDAVHQMRVAARRLRSVIGTFQPLLERRRTETVRVGLRVLGEALAPVRDSEVMLAYFAGVDPEPAVLLVRQSLRETTRSAGRGCWRPSTTAGTRPWSGR